MSDLDKNYFVNLFKIFCYPFYKQTHIHFFAINLHLLSKHLYIKFNTSKIELVLFFLLNFRTSNNQRTSLIKMLLIRVFAGNSIKNPENSFQKLFSEWLNLNNWRDISCVTLAECNMLRRWTYICVHSIFFCAQFYFNVTSNKQDILVNIEKLLLTVCDEYVIVICEACYNLGYSTSTNVANILAFLHLVADIKRIY